MKKYVLLLCLIFFFLSGFCQSVSEVKDKKIVGILSRVDTLILKRGNDLFLSIFQVNNGPGSAGLSESHEVSHDLIICVSEYDEYPEKRIFRIGPFFDPVIAGEKDLRNGYVLEIQHGVPRTRGRIVVQGLQLRYE